MLRIFVFILLILSTRFSVNSQIQKSEDGSVWEIDKQTVVSLNGNWKFRHISGSSWSSYSDFYLPSYDASSWGDLEVPANWEMKNVTGSQYVIPPDGIGLYRTIFQVPAQWSDSNVYIRFDGVLMGYEFWVNGNYVGKWESAYNSCQFNITPYLQAGDNLLAVRVYTRYPGYEFDTHDDWAVSGIFRDVSIFPVADHHLNYFKTESFITGADAELHIKYAVSSFSLQSLQNVNVQGEVYNPSGSLVANFSTSINEIVTGKSDTLTEIINISGASLWTAETPSLYTVRMTVQKEGNPVQDFERKTGLRQIEIVNRQILLNGSPVKLRGVNYHETDPYKGKTLDRAHRLNDLMMMKKANINFVRTSHYPSHPELFDLCDSLGFYVICEVPFGFGDQYLEDPAYKLPLMNRADATVSRHQNHPSVIIWSVGNENEITSMTAEVGLHVKHLDPTRPICYPQAGGMFYWRNYNNYPAHIDVFAPHYPDAATLTHYINTAQRPLLITEITHSLGLAFEDHDKLWEIIQQNDITAGAAVWDWADQAVARQGNRTDNYVKTNHTWLNNTTYFDMNDNQGADGIVYADRTPQTDYWETRKVYAQARVSNYQIPVIQGSQTVNIEISNRYDFIDLQDAVTCHWFLTRNRDTVQSGNFVPVCAARQSIMQGVNITIPDDPASAIYLLHLNFINVHGQNINDHTVRLLSGTGRPDLVSWLGDAALPAVPVLSFPTDSIRAEASAFNFSMSSLNGMLRLDHQMNLIQKGPFIRAGRRMSIAEDVTVKGKILEKYIMDNSSYTPGSTVTDGDTVRITGDYLYDNNNIQMQGSINYKLIKNGTIEVSFDITPSGANKLLLESGVAFLLNKDITEARWLGFGPFSSYKGKQNLNNYGIFYRNENDIYFEGNKKGVDLALLTDVSGNGILIIADSANISFEKTDEGIIVTYNTHIAGLGSKFAETAYPVYSGTMGKLKGGFYIVPVDGNNWYDLLNDLFGGPDQTGEVTDPFIATSDTYWQKFSAITGGESGCELTVTASASDGPNVPENTMDNNLNTRWSGNGIGVHITYTFCEPVQIDAVKIAFQNGSSRVFTFDLLSSLDGTNFTVIQSNVTSSGTTNDLETYSFDPVVAKYFRIVGKGNTQNTWTSITEVKFVTQLIPAAVVETTENKKSLLLFPNPATDELTIVFDGGIKQIEILSTKGTLLKSIPGDNSFIVITTAELKPGTYLVKVYTEKDVITSKFVKK